MSENLVTQRYTQRFILKIYTQESFAHNGT